MAQEYFELERGSFMAVLGILPMDFLIDPSHGISIPHFEFSKVLVLRVKALFEISDGLFCFLCFLNLLIQAVQLDPKIALRFCQSLQELRMPINISPIVAD
jgi:hypothetical protein